MSASNTHIADQGSTPTPPEISDLRQKLLIAMRDIFERDMLGRVADSFNIDKVGWINAALTSCNYAQANMQDAKRCAGALDLLSLGLSKVSISGLYLEFGVFSGTSINHIAATCPGSKIFGFDSFEGLPESWRPGFSKGAFARKNLPVVADNVELVVGWFDQTLPKFCDDHPAEIVSFLHVDCDLYSSTKTIFTQFKGRIVPGTVIVFDEYFNYPGWEQHEAKAFREFCNDSDIQYEYVGLVPHHQQAAVRITG